MIDLARRSGAIKSIWADVVREGDVFEYERGMDDKLRHIEGAERGAISHFYSYAHLKDGGFVFDVKNIVWMNTHMLTTQSKGAYGPWKDHYEAMGRKTMVRRLFNYLPVSIEMAEAQAVDATGDTKVQNMGQVLDGEYSVLDDVYEDSTNEGDAGGADPAAPTQPDANGEIFDPEVHLATASGMPMYNQDDTFRKRPQRQAAAVETNPPPEEQTPPPPEPDQEQQEEPPWDDDAQAAADAEDAARGAGGDDEDPDAGISVE
jgi:hypothetical protein